MSLIGLSSALGAAYDIKKADNVRKVSNMSNEQIWKAMNPDANQEDIQYHLTRMDFDDESQLYDMVDNAARDSFLNVLNAQLDEGYSDYSGSLAMKSNGALEEVLEEPAKADEEPKIVESAMLYKQLVNKLGSQVYKAGVEAETNYSLKVDESPFNGTYSASKADDVHKWFVGAANGMVIDAVYDRLFGSSLSSN